MSYSRSLGADTSPVVRSHLTAASSAAGQTLQSTSSGGVVTRVLIVGAVAGGAFLLWRKFRKRKHP